MELTGDLEKDVENHIAGYKTSQEINEKTVEMLASMATLPAWHVGVISPGFLGLLFNFDKLYAHTRLPAEWFMGIFVGTEAVFLLGIISCVLTYNYFNALALLIGLQGAKFQELHEHFSTLKRSNGVVSETVKEGITEATKTAQDITEQRQKPTPKYIDWAMKHYGDFALYGYVGVFIIIVTLRFWANTTSAPVGNSWPQC